MHDNALVEGGYNLQLFMSCQPVRFDVLLARIRQGGNLIQYCIAISAIAYFSCLHYFFDIRIIVYCVSGVVLILLAPRIAKSNLFYYVVGVVAGVIFGFFLSTYFVLKLFNRAFHPVVVLLTLASSSVVSGIFLFSVYTVVHSPMLTSLVVLFAAIGILFTYWCGPPSIQIRNLASISLMFCGLIINVLACGLACASFVPILIFIKRKQIRETIERNFYCPFKSKEMCRQYLANCYVPCGSFLNEEQYFAQGILSTASGLEDLRTYCLENPTILDRLKEYKATAMFVHQKYINDSDSDFSDHESV